MADSGSLLWKAGEKRGHVCFSANQHKTSGPKTLIQIFFFYVFKNYSQPIWTNSCQIRLAVLVWFISSHRRVHKLLVIKLKRGSCPATVEHIQTWWPGNVCTIKLITERNFNAWNIFKSKTVCLYVFEIKICYSMTWTTAWIHKKTKTEPLENEFVWLYMQDSLMNKVEISSSWQDVSLQLHPEERSALYNKYTKKTAVCPRRFLLFDDVITDILQFIIFTKWHIVNVENFQGQFWSPFKNMQ